MDLHLGAIDTTNINIFRGRKREEQSEKSQAIQMHEHVTYKVKSIMGSAQSNPTSTQAYYTHLNA